MTEQAMNAPSPSRRTLLEWIRDHGATVIQEDFFGEEELQYLRDGSSGQYLLRRVDLVCAAPTRESRMDERTLALELGRIRGTVKLRLPGGQDRNWP